MNNLTDCKLLTPDELARYCKVPRQTVYGWIHRGRLSKIKAGHAIRIRADEVHENIRKYGNILRPIAK